ncbi:hypothetical protein GGI23_007375, partial [Coemansia sp. RSA 2559]
YAGSQTAQTSNPGATSTPAGIDPASASHDTAAMNNQSASRDAMTAAAAAAAAAAAVASNGAVLPTADYSRGYGTMASVNHGHMLPPPTHIHAQQHQAQQQHAQYS